MYRFASLPAAVAGCAAAFILSGCRTPDPFVEVDASKGDFACGRTADGIVWCWGRNSFGELGVKPRRRALSPLPKPEPKPLRVGALSNVVQVDLGFSLSCALLGDGTVRCWGQGVCKNDDDTTCYTPTAVPGLEDVAQIATARQVCALHRSGRVSCARPKWRKSVVKSIVGLKGAVEIAAGSSHTCARLRDGTVQCWGERRDGILGDGAQNATAGRAEAAADLTTPTRVVSLEGVTDIAAGGLATCAVVAGGKVRCWGKNERGVLGNGKFGGVQPVPQEVVGLTDAVQVAVDRHACARMRDGTVRCWGCGHFGALGNGTLETDYAATPVAVEGLSGVREIAVGANISCARTASGTYCWGHNNYGAVGDGTTSDRALPVRIAGSQ